MLPSDNNKALRDIWNYPSADACFAPIHHGEHNLTLSHGNIHANCWYMSPSKYEYLPIVVITIHACLLSLVF